MVARSSRDDKSTWQFCFGKDLLTSKLGQSGFIISLTSEWKLKL